MYVHIYIYKYTHTHTHTHTHRSHQDDVQYLESQMVTLKKENHKLKRELEDTATGSYIHRYTPTYLHTYLPTYIHTYDTYINTYMHTNIQMRTTDSSANSKTLLPGLNSS